MLALAACLADRLPVDAELGWHASGYGGPLPGGRVEGDLPRGGRPT